MLSKERKDELVKQFGKNETDTGSASVQVAILTARINYLTEHFKTHKQDFQARRGLLKMVGRRRSFLNYIKKKDVTQYRSIIAELKLRK